MMVAAERLSLFSKDELPETVCHLKWPATNTYRSEPQQIHSRLHSFTHMCMLVYMFVCDVKQ